MAFATRWTAADHTENALDGKRRIVQATLDAGREPGNRAGLPYDENELRRFLRGGLAAK